MSFDALALAALRQELTGLLVGGRVQRIVRVSELALGLELYAGERHQLLLSAETAAPQIRVVSHKLRRGEEKPSPLSLLLHKYVEGARLVEIIQPELERVLILSFGGQHGATRLVCELMGNLSNLVLVDADGRIMEAAKRVPGSVNRYREVLPRRPYVPPPPQDKLHPLQASPEALLAQIMALEGPLYRRVAQAVAGVSPLLAREVVFRATGEASPAGDMDPALAQRLLVALGVLWGLPASGAWQPSVGYREAQGEQEPTALTPTARTPGAFAPYELTHWPERESHPTLLAAIERVLGQPSAEAVRAPAPSLDGYERARLRLTRLITQQIERREHRLASMREGLVSPEELEALQFEASAILAIAWRIEPGQREVLATRAEVTGEAGARADEVVRIALDPELSPSENAQALFEQYRKRQAALAQVPELIAATELEIATLRQMATDAALASDRAQLDEVEAALREAGYLRSRRKAMPAASAGPIMLTAPDGLQLLVGRNSRQNAEVTFRRAAPDDRWLHAHGVPGSHVVIRCGEREVSAATLALAARLAAYYSAARSEARVQVDHVARKHVRPIPGAGPGMVTYRNESAIVVTPDAAEIAKLGLR